MKKKHKSLVAKVALVVTVLSALALLINFVILPRVTAQTTGLGMILYDDDGNVIYNSQDRNIFQYVIYRYTSPTKTINGVGSVNFVGTVCSDTGGIWIQLNPIARKNGAINWNEMNSRINKGWGGPNVIEATRVYFEKDGECHTFSTGLIPASTYTAELPNKAQGCIKFMVEPYEAQSGSATIGGQVTSNEVCAQIYPVDAVLTATVNEGV